MAPQDFTFRAFAQQGFYRNLNARLVDMAGITPGQRIVDLACGTGAVTKLILERLKSARESVVIGIDQSSIALRQAIEELANARESAIQFVQGKVEHLSQVIKESVDTIVFCNGIHYIEDKGSLLEEVQKTLKPGGVFAFNTSFFEGAHTPESGQFYRRWMFKAIRDLKDNYGLMPVRSEKVESRKQLTPEQYEALLVQHGLRIQSKEISTVQVPLEGWLDISQFEDFISGIMPGVPLDKASTSLKESVTKTFQELNISVVPRNWLHVVAIRV
ncbi:MAG: methyltransferase domain-containing protein [Chloroflexi bacterium]|nr:methyltransferase domain-containing protein [Chloroflexota bacterium]